MSWQMFNATATVVRPAWQADRYGDQIPDWSAAERRELSGLCIQPSAQVLVANEQITADGRDVRMTHWRVYTALGTDADVLATDRIEWEGRTFEVVGEVARWPHPLTGQVHHIEFTIERVQG
ncbi:hypothetical protein [Microtetraspora malaysiensis]|uniref:Head-to-tail stopper n=1 Tax=Microtetraspora malaysiensis TaxID=161358 RepID=A0ABW6T378_9ACTN